MHEAQISQVRRFNRLITQRVGALEQDYLRRGRPLGEARLLFEIGRAGANVRTLRRRLGLDSGYLSRLLRALQSDGLIEVTGAAEDRRVRLVRLTPEGLEEYGRYDQLSDELASSLLEPLDPAQRERLSAAMAEIERLLRAGLVELRLESPDGRHARWCMRQYFNELAARFEAGFDPGAGGAEGDREMMAPTGVFVLARLEGEPVGCGGLKLDSGGFGELKRLWVAPSARGYGIARRIVRDLEGRARAAGVKILRLDTNRTLAEAQALYRSEGFDEIERYNDNPYAHHWFAKRL